MIISRNKAYSSKIDDAKYDKKNLLDSASKAEGAVSLGALGYGAYKTGQAGKEVYDRVKGKKSTLSKLKELRKTSKKVLKGSTKSLKELEQREKILEGVEKSAKEDINKSKESLGNIKKSLEGKTTVDAKVHDALKKKIAGEKKNIEVSKKIIESAKSTKKLNAASKNLKKGKIAVGVALATGISSTALKIGAKKTKKERREKIFSIQSGRPDREGSLGRELANKAKQGAGVGAIVGTAVGASVGITSLDLETLGITTIGGLTLGAVLGAFGNMFNAIGAGGRMKRAKEVNMNQVLDYLEDIISESRNDGLNVRGKNLVSRYIGLDQDPKQFDITLSCKNGIAIFLVRNSIGEKIMKGLSEQLEYVVKDNRKATYTSKKIKEGYLVELVVPSVKAIANLIYNICYTLHQRVNCITKNI